MKPSDVSVHLAGPAGPIQLHIKLAPNRSIQEAWGGHTDDSDTNKVLIWLAAWLSGLEMSYAYENVAEAFLKTFPELPWNWSQIPQEIVRQALYQTHPRVQVEIEDKIICRCHKITESTLKKVLEDRPNSNVQDLGLLTKAGSGCGSCRVDLEKLILESKPNSRRWHGESYAFWALKAQDSLEVWKKRARWDWVKEKSLLVTSFKDGVVYVQVKEGLTADQEWDLNQALADYWTEGFPAPLSLFLDFTLL